MRLTINNIGMLRNADIEINGITVIAGENDTGKSTVGKALFAVFQGFHNSKEQPDADRIGSISYYIRSALRENSARMSLLTAELAREIVINKSEYRDAKNEILSELLSRVIPDFHNMLPDASYAEQLFDRIRGNLNISDDSILTSNMERLMMTEFNGQINSLATESQGKIGLHIRGEKPVTVTIFHHAIKDIDNYIDLRTEAIYIDDPLVLNSIGRLPSAYLDSRMGLSRGLSHRSHLVEKLSVEPETQNISEQLRLNKKLEYVYRRLSDVCDGDLIRNQNSRYFYRTKELPAPLDVRNLSMGLKTFVMIKRLLLNGTLEENGTVILDEPEIHLHPEWQLVLAELIVLLQKEFGMHVLLTTHSPYFLRAIQVYSAIYAVADKCKYYLAEKTGSFAEIQDVSENIDRIYDLLVDPFQKLEDLRWQDDDID